MGRGVGADGLQRGCATPLFQAVYSGELALLDHLLKQGANATHVTTLPGRETPLYNAARFPRVAVRLLEAGGDPHAQNTNGLTIMQIAEPHVREKITTYLQEFSGYGNTTAHPQQPFQPPGGLVSRTISWIANPPEPFMSMEDYLPHYRADCINVLLESLRFYYREVPESVSDFRLLGIEMASRSGSGGPLSPWECNVCKASINGDKARHMCTQCDATLCSDCHADYVKAHAADGEVEDGNRVKGLKLLHQMETRAYAFRCVAHALREQAGLFIKTIGIFKYFGHYDEFVKPFLTEYEEWTTTYNSSQEFAEILTPGWDFLKVVEVASRWKVDDPDDVVLELLTKVEKSLRSHYEQHSIDKELEYFFCDGHAYIEVPVLADMPDSEKECFETDGRLKDTYLCDMQRRYEESERLASVTSTHLPVGQTFVAAAGKRPYFVEDEEVYHRRLVRNFGRDLRARYLNGLDFTCRTSSMVERIMKGLRRSDITFVPRLPLETDELLLESMSYEMSWQFVQVFLFGYVSTSLTDLFIREQQDPAPEEEAMITLSINDAWSELLRGEPQIEDEFLVGLPDEIREDLITFAWRAKDFENMPIATLKYPLRRNGGLEAARDETWDALTVLRPWCGAIEAFCSSKETRENAPFRVWDFYGNPVLARLVGKARRGTRSYERI
ncbi:hypothetical protein B0T16DRAFT_423477 [Cercophora newfieldiana]|uniref:Ankyrin n=1 Tax=Cercophora newfieldiana TaxID=92897 RepID=A0AA40CI15_9PEZI|nr:hypothetical protein B0T16DRAFT_423477 [Cercophora newfieldiana]